MNILEERKKINAYLIQNGIPTTIKDKEKKKKLNNIIFNEKLNLDAYELDKNKYGPKEYVKVILESETKKFKAIDCRERLKAVIKVEKRIAREEKYIEFKVKVKELFKK